MSHDYTVNNLTRDEFGRPSGIVALNKEAGISSHDLVDKLRKQLSTRKVGHAGALDVFASGLLILLVGRSTKLSNTLINLDKEYECRVILGVSTDTQDPEGTVTETTSIKDSKLVGKAAPTIISSFIGKQKQHVSTYSSVKVDGQKLRVLMRDERYNPEIEFRDNNKKFIIFNPKQANPQLRKFEVEVPQKDINLYTVELLEHGEADSSFVHEISSQLPDDSKLYYLDIKIACSKGTYIRQFAEDLGKSFGYPAMLASLKRTKVGKVSLENVVELSHL